MQTLDVITIGRSSVDLYGAQIGGRLEDMGSFEKYIGGSPTNIACGTARLGLTSALITRVGDEHMGRFIIEQLGREGVDTRGVKVDPERLTALVILGIRDRERFPLIFYRENCADMALCEDDINEDLVRSARSLVVTGTHLSHPRTEAAVLKALRVAREAGIKTALDIDYRPNLWGVAGHGEGMEEPLRREREGHREAAIEPTPGFDPHQSEPEEELRTSKPAGSTDSGDGAEAAVHAPLGRHTLVAKLLARQWRGRLPGGSHPGQPLMTEKPAPAGFL